VLKTLLEARDVRKQFGGLSALDGVSVNVAAGSLHAIIGPNGSGKTTFFNAITGIFPLSSGEILLDGKRISGREPHEISRHGIARTFQNLLIFGQMTVLENVQIGLQCRSRYSLLRNVFTDPFFSAAAISARDEASALLDFVGLPVKVDQLASSLAYGDQRLLEIARALATKPKLILLDEPAAGMNPQESHKLMHTVRRIRDRLGITVLIIEHDMNLVMNLAETLTVLENGRKIAEGSPDAVRADTRVVEAYLGVANAESVAKLRKRGPGRKAEIL
jgi:branched-chain amino acid transport system ATP-binding protein